MTTLRRRRERGQSLVEFGLILPIFLLIVFGIIDLGRAVYAYHTINNAAREAGRVAVVDQTFDHIEQTAMDQAVGLGLVAADVTVDWRHVLFPNTANSCAVYLGSNDAVSCTAIVRVEYDYTAATPIIGNIVGLIPMAGESQMIIEFNCQEPSAPSCPVGQ